MQVSDMATPSTSQNAPSPPLPKPPRTTLHVEPPSRRANNNVATVYLCLCSAVEHNIRCCHEAVPNPEANQPPPTRPNAPPPIDHRLSPDMRLENKIMLGGRRRAAGRENSSDCAKETPKVIVNIIKEEREGTVKRGSEEHAH